MFPERQEGGSIFITSIGAMSFEDFATFADNTAHDVSSRDEKRALPARSTRILLTWYY